MLNSVSLTSFINIFWCSNMVVFMVSVCVFYTLCFIFCLDGVTYQVFKKNIDVSDIPTNINYMNFTPTY